MFEDPAVTFEDQDSTPSIVSLNPERSLVTTKELLDFLDANTGKEVNGNISRHNSELSHQSDSDTTIKGENSGEQSNGVSRMVQSDEVAEDVSNTSTDKAQETQNLPRRSIRRNKGIPPARLGEVYTHSVVIGEPIWV